MGLQLTDALAEQAHVLDQAADFVANLVGRLAHAGILLDLLHQRDASMSSDGDTMTTFAR